MYGRGAGLGISTAVTTVSAGSIAALPNTGSHRLLSLVLTITLIAGIVATIVVGSKILAIKLFNN